LETTLRELTQEVEHTYRLSLEFDRRRQSHETQVLGLHLDLNTLDKLLTTQDEAFSASSLRYARAACSQTEDFARHLWDTTTLPEIQRWIDFFRGHSTSPPRARQELMDHITTRLEEVHQMKQRTCS
jgi:hypothetical protein